MKVTWEVDDGYVGGSRPQTVEVDDNELADCENEEQRRQLIEDYVQEDFENKVTWYITHEED